MSEERTFTSKDSEGKEQKFLFRDLSQVILSGGDLIYREYFSKAIRSGVMTNAEAVKILKDRGIWGEKEEEKMLEFQVKLIEQEVALSKMHEKNEESVALFNKIKETRGEIETLRQVKSSVTENTAESMASEMRNQYFASECVVYYNSREKVFKSLDDFLARLDEEVATDSYKEALICNYEKQLGISLPKGFEAKLPEDDWLDKVTPKEEEEKPVTKKKRTRKKRTPSKKTTSAK